MTIRLGTRGSALALAQTELAANALRLRGFDVRIVIESWNAVLILYINISAPSGARNAVKTVLNTMTFALAASSGVSVIAVKCSRSMPQESARRSLPLMRIFCRSKIARTANRLCTTTGCTLRS